MTEPQHIKVKAKEVTMPNIQQFYLEVQEKKKFDVLTRLLDIQSPSLQSYLVVQSVVLMNYQKH